MPNKPNKISTIFWTFSLEDLWNWSSERQQVSESPPVAIGVQLQELGGDARQHTRPFMVLESTSWRNPHQGEKLPLYWNQFLIDCGWLLPPANEVWGKVIFSQACHSFCSRGGGGGRWVCIQWGDLHLHRILQDTVNKQAVCILLECILVCHNFWIFPFF